MADASIDLVSLCSHCEQSTRTDRRLACTYCGAPRVADFLVHEDREKRQAIAQIFDPLGIIV